MFRKTIIATAAIATLVAAALPTTASAHHFRHRGHGFGIGFAGVYVGGGCQTVYEWRRTRHGRLYQVPVTYCY
jgi:hypothetical protein